MADLMKLSGFKEMGDAMRELGPRVAKNTLRRAVSSGAAVIRNEAKSRAPVATGEMQRDIMVKRERDTKGQMSATYSVFVRSGRKSRLSGKTRDVQKDSFYWRFVEFGTSKMPARPFIRPAFEAKKDVAVSTIGEALAAGIQKAAAEVAK